jgi:hypothetical protein
LILKAFENTSTNVAASQMRNALNKLADTVTDPAEKKVSRNPFATLQAPFSAHKFRYTCSGTCLQPQAISMFGGELGQVRHLSVC